MESTPATLVTRNPRWGLGVGVLVAATLAFLFVSSRDPSAYAAVGSVGFTFGLIPVAAWLGYHAARRVPVRVRVDDRGLRVLRDGVERLVRRRVWLKRGTARVTPEGSYRVDLHASFLPELRLEIDRDEDARALLAALGLDRRDGTTRFRLRWHPAGRSVGIAGTVVFAFFAIWLTPFGGAWVIGGLILAGLVPLFDRRFFGVELVVGVDGIETRGGSGARRFIPHARIARVDRVRNERLGSSETVSPGFSVLLDDGEVLAFDTRDERFRTGVWKTDPIFEATRDAWEKARGVSPAQTVSAALLCGPRSTKEWVSALRATGSGEATTGYRVAALDERVLFDVVADARALPEVRVAAAVALGSRAEHASRLRVIADDLAEPTVRRIALMAASETPAATLEDEIDSALTSRRSTCGTRRRGSS